MSHPVGCIILTNADDLHFLTATLQQINTIFKDIVIAYGTTLWNGEADDLEKLQAFKQRHAHMHNVRFVTYNVQEDKLTFMANQVTPAMYWEAHARYISLEALDKTCEYIMFLDADEVVDGAMFQRWLDTHEYKEYDAMKLANYWYWRTPELRARNYIEDSVVFIKRNVFNPFMLFSNMGRHGMFENCKSQETRKIRQLTNMNAEVMVHHYSWVRTKEAMMRKVKNWGHRGDRQNWVDLVEQEFNTTISENHHDFLKGLSYDIVENTFNIQM